MVLGDQSGSTSASFECPTDTRRLLSSACASREISDRRGDDPHAKRRSGCIGGRQQRGASGTTGLARLPGRSSGGSWASGNVPTMLGALRESLTLASRALNHSLNRTGGPGTPVLRGWGHGRKHVKEVSVKPRLVV